MSVMAGLLQDPVNDSVMAGLLQDPVNDSVMAGLLEDPVNDSVVAGPVVTLTAATPSPMSTLECFQLYMPHEDMFTETSQLHCLPARFRTRPLISRLSLLCFPAESPVPLSLLPLECSEFVSR